MNIHSYCRRSVTETRKVLGIKAGILDAVKGTSQWEVYRKHRVGSFPGCCKWSAISAYLDGLESEKEPPQ